ncbi:ferredoxin [Methanobrevibacter sp. TMH8]|uniref:ferredoxin n=1 Tax=Methanobrevibacter sp. TMH8 TaxID=2848611 RepID=UPI001CC8F517|nr:ferredoxin [Methanobrevibacter sp. TMH8]MBZ9571695.1 ferredoxin [Methanobrevibacter sp. TMH8]
MVYKIEIEMDLCIACGNCVTECEEMFKIVDDRSTLIDGEINEDNFSIKEYDDISCGIDAAEMCPVECIIVYEDDIAIN